MPTYPSYPEASSLEPTDLVAIYRATVGTLTIPLGFLPIFAGALINTSGLILQPGTYYGIKSSLGAYTVTLPELSLQNVPSLIMLIDIDYNVNNNNLIIQGYGTDKIALFNSSGPSQTLNVAGVWAILVANTNSWRLIVSTS